MADKEIHIRPVRQGDVIRMTRLVLAARGFRGRELEAQIDRDLARFREQGLVELLETETLIAEIDQRMVGIMRYGEFDADVHLMRPEIEPFVDQEQVSGAFFRSLWTCLPERIKQAIFIDYPHPEGLLGPLLLQNGFTVKVKRTDMRLTLAEPLPAWKGRLTFQSYSPALHGRFLRAFEASFAGALDPMMEWDARHPEESFAIFQSRFGHFEPMLWVLASAENGQDVGFAMFQHFDGGRYAGDEVLLYTAVLPEMRGQGFGEAIVREGLRRIRVLRGAQASVSLTVSDPNTPARNIYQRLGFRPVESFAVYASQRPELPSVSDGARRER